MIYNPTLAAYAVESPVLMSELRHGIDRGELRVHFQPKINVTTGRMMGVEALMRWEHPYAACSARACSWPPRKTPR